MSLRPSVKVTAPSRIHFGLFGGEDAKGTSFGGLGAMVGKPGIELTLEPSDQYSVHGPQDDRLDQFVRAWCQNAYESEPAGFRLTLDHSPPSHIGLGTGTQLGMAISAALFQYHFGEVPSIERVAKGVGRGRRSGVGLYGFLHGGMIVDRGRNHEQSLPQLDMHLPIPEHWRFVLLNLTTAQSVFGEKEKKVFERNNEIDLISFRNQLIELAKDQIVPAVLAEDFKTFSESIFQFGKLSGSYFSSIQGGPFNGRRITEIIEIARGLGFAGVGQSSWGPTVYALAESPENANHLADSMSVHLHEDESIIIAPPSSHGATVSVFENTASSP